MGVDRSAPILWGCGCRTWREGDRFMVRPCSRLCPVYHAVLAESRTLGNPIEFRRAPPPPALERAP